MRVHVLGWQFFNESLTMKFLFVTVSGKFGQGLYPWDGMSSEALTDEFKKHDCHVEFVECENILKKREQLPEYNAVIFGGSQIPSEKKVIEDYAYVSKMLGACVVPHYELILAHENKGIQGLLEKARGIKTIPHRYGVSTTTNYQPGYVYKTIDGAGSFGVALPKTQHELRKFIRRNAFLHEQPLRLWQFAKQRLKLLMRHKNYTKSKEQYFAPTLPIVSQKLIPDLKNDYKILVFYDLFFVLKRNVRKNDFRASGSGLFERTRKIPFEILDLAESYREKLDTPYLSIDVAFDGKQAFCIEFQCCHFGPITYLDAESAFQKTRLSWGDTPWEKKSLEWGFAYAITKHIQSKASLNAHN